MFKLKLPNWLKQVCNATALVILLAATINNFNIPVQAQKAYIKPSSTNVSSSSKWFVYTANPGETINDVAIINNPDSKPIKVSIQANDASVTSNGQYTITDNNKINTGLGSWVNVEKDETIEVPAKSSVEVPFSVTIPNDIEPGEYAGGISVTPNVGGDGNVATVFRMASRIYIYVPGEGAEVKAEVTELQAFDTSLENLAELARTHGFINPEAMSLRFKVNNTSNIYQKLSGNLEITFPDGSVESVPNNYDINKSDNSYEYFIQTPHAYQPGETKFKFTYEVKAFTQSVSNDTTPIVGELEYAMNMTQEEIDLIAQYREQNTKQLVQKYGKKPEKKTSLLDEYAQANGEIQQVSTDENAEEMSQSQQIITEEVIEKSSNHQVIIIAAVAGGVLLLAIITLLVIVLRKKNASEDKKQS